MHLAISLILTTFIGYHLIQGLLGQHYPVKELYHGAEFRFVNTPGVRSSDFVVKRSNHQFLFAPNAPRELKSSIELSAAGEYSATIEAEYPHWLCDSKDLDKAKVLISGGSLNEYVNLVRGAPEEVVFTAAKGQRLTLTVTNRQNRECGRAQLTLFRITDSTALKIGLILVWSCVLALCIFSLSSPYITTFGVLMNTILISAEASLGTLSTSTVVVNTGLSLGFTGALFYLSAIPFRSRIVALLATAGLALLVAPALSFIAYERVFSAPFSIEAVHGAMQSYGSQALEFWQQYVGKRRTLYVLFVVFIIYLLMRQLNQARAIASKTLVFGLLLILTGSALTVGRLHDSGIYNLLLKSIIIYRWEIDAFQKVASQRKSFATQASRKAEHTDDTTVIVYGESVNKKQMSAYGYVRQTTPLLDRRIAAGEVVLFTNAYSNHTHSNPTMSMMLTQADQYRGKPWQESPSIFNYASAAGVETHWLTNHRLLGGWSNNITTIIREADRLKTINFMIGRGLESTYYDPDLVPLFKQSILERPNQLTLLHLYNSHSFYCNRYPKDFSQFDGKLPTIKYGGMLRLKRANDFMVNCYDNTIFYADLVLEQLIDELDNRSNPSVLLYVADHAEEFLDDRTHNSAVFTFDMIDIPLVIWANQAWREKHSAVWNTLKSNSNKVVTNDFMFESALGLAGIVASSIDIKNDITSSSYTEPNKPLTLHGRLAVNHPNNWNYWQRQNLRFAKQENLSLRVVDVESVGEATRALAMGINKLQINIDLSLQDDLVLISKDSKEAIGTVADFVASLDKSGVSSIALSLNPGAELESKTSNSRLQELVTNLEENTQIPLTITPAVATKPLNLAQLNFSEKVIELSTRTGKVSEEDSIPVVLSSRYTNPPPEPETLP